MSQRFNWAIMACETHDLLALAKIMTAAVQETLSEGGMPHLDPACRLLCHQIAMAGNGDLPFTALYDKIYDYCSLRAGNGPNFTYHNVAIEPVPPQYDPN